MPKCDRPTIDIHTRNVQIQQPHVGQWNHCKCFVDLMEVHYRHPSTMQRSPRSTGRCHCKVCWLNAMIGKCQDTRRSTDTELTCSLSADQDDSGCAVIEGGGTCSCDRPPILEDWRQGGHDIQLQARILLICADDDCLALERVADHGIACSDGSDLGIHATTLPSVGCAAVGGNRVAILFLPQDAHLPRGYLRARTQVALAGCIPKAVLQHRVLEHTVAIVVAAHPRVPQEVRGL
mmetsp:Transcript_125509/g.349363  ORF Transcript_125509/g.349363 Transcript_125509/m.349363 type:complete len:235 (+) Transcript_125509:82-786(+)